MQNREISRLFPGFWDCPIGTAPALAYTHAKLSLSQQEQLRQIDHNLLLEQMADLKEHRFGRSSERHESDEQISFMEVDGCRSWG